MTTRRNMLLANLICAIRGSVFYIISHSTIHSGFQLKRRIEVLQNENLESKSWELTGEASARDRPANSALEEHLQFDHSTRQAPIITETSTAKLEAVIKARIRDKVGSLHK